MLNKIYELVLEHGSAIFPYIEILALHDKGGQGNEIKVNNKKYSSRTLDTLVDIGFIRYDSVGDNHVIQVSEGSIFEGNFRYLCIPKSETKEKVRNHIEKRRPKQNLEPNKDLESLVAKAGYPSDWVKSQGKYKVLFRNCVKKYGLETMQGFAEYLSEHDEKDARSLFTHSFIESYKSGSLQKGDPNKSGFIKSRQEENYEQEDF